MALKRVFFLVQSFIYLLRLCPTLVYLGVMVGGDPRYMVPNVSRSRACVAICTLFAPRRNKNPCKSTTYRVLFVAGVGPEPTTSGL